MSSNIGLIYDRFGIKSQSFDCFANAANHACKGFVTVRPTSDWFAIRRQGLKSAQWLETPVTITQDDWNDFGFALGVTFYCASHFDVEAIVRIEKAGTDQ